MAGQKPSGCDLHRCHSRKFRSAKRDCDSLLVDVTFYAEPIAKGSARVTVCLLIARTVDSAFRRCPWSKRWLLLNIIGASASQAERCR